MSLDITIDDPLSHRKDHQTGTRHPHQWSSALLWLHGCTNLKERLKDCYVWLRDFVWPVHPSEPEKHRRDTLVHTHTCMLFGYSSLSSHSVLISLTLSPSLSLPPLSETRGEQQRCGWMSLKTSTMPPSPRPEMSPTESKNFLVRVRQNRIVETEKTKDGHRVKWIAN